VKNGEDVGFLSRKTISGLEKKKTFPLSKKKWDILLGSEVKGKMASERPD